MSKRNPSQGRKVGDEPRQMTITPSGADPATLEQLNPPAARDDVNADEPGESAPLVKDVVNHDHIVEAQHQGATHGSALDKEGVRHYGEDEKPDEVGGGEDTEGDEPGVLSFGDQGEPYDIFARSGAQQPGGQHMADGPSTKKNADISGVEKVAALVSHMPKDTPDDHVVYGYAGYKITIGDLREIGGADRPKASEQSQDDE